MYKHNVPANIGYLRWHDLLLQTYIGITRKESKDFLLDQEPKQVFAPVQARLTTKAQISRQPLRAWAMDYTKMGTSSHGFTAIWVIVDR